MMRAHIYNGMIIEIILHYNTLYENIFSKFYTCLVLLSVFTTPLKTTLEVKLLDNTEVLFLDDDGVVCVKDPFDWVYSDCSLITFPEVELLEGLPVEINKKNVWSPYQCLFIY